MLTRSYTVDEIAHALLVRLSGNTADKKRRIDRIVTDSRYRGIGESSLFFAIRSKLNDGHRFLEDAYSKGVRAFVVEKGRRNEKLKEGIFIEVEDVLQALQKLASSKRSEMDYPIIGITGSNGKTIVKEWLFQILSTRKNVYKSPKSYNSQIGLPLSILLSPPHCDLAIFEAGISMPGEMQKLQSVLEADIGLITNIHKAHIENFKNQQQLLTEKLLLFSSASQIIYRSDYELIHKELKDNPTYRNKVLISWSTDETVHSTYRVQYDKRADDSEITVSDGKKKLSFTVPFTDEASLENATHCIITALHLRIAEKQIQQVTAQLTSVPMRLQLLEGLNNCTLINDSYNSDLTSLEIALNFLNIQGKQEKKTLILSDILQSGIEPAELYRKVDELCLGNGIDRIIGVGSEIRAQQGNFRCHIVTFTSTDELINQLNEISFVNESILLKGSRPFEFERVSNLLVNKRHETSLEVNLSAVIDNLNFFRSRLKTGVDIMVMVKAFSYGTGTYEIANVLEHYGANYLAVAYIDEGVLLREKGINLPIMVMNPAIGEIDRIIEYKLEPEVYNLSDLKRIDSFTREKGGKVSIHLKLETGMHRLGIERDELAEVCTVIRSNKKMELKTVFSHLVASDDASFDDFTQKQIRAFESMSQEIKKNGIDGFKRHILNSDGILRFPDCQFDMVRLGIGLYGITSIPEYRNKLRSVVRLTSRISQIKQLKGGESVGYSRRFIATGEKSTATVPIGYADGLVRKLGNGNWSFRLGSTRAPILGSICMDMTMIDISGIEDVREKDEVVVIDGNADIYKLAEVRGTIPYEILTSISERVKRVFYFGD